MGMTELIDELTILAYRKLYGELAVPANKRLSTIRDLDELINHYQPFIESLQKDNHISFISFGRFNEACDQFVRSTFSQSFVKRFDTVPAEPATAPMMIYNMETTLILTLIQAALEGTKKHRKQTVKEHEHKYRTLCEARSCLADYGLHPAIAKRSQNEFHRYNVLIELKQKNERDEYELLIDLKTLNRHYLDPYTKKQPILLDGKNIDFKNIERITISSTTLFDEEIKLFRLRYKKYHDIDFIKACTNETNALIRQAMLNIEKTDTKKNTESSSKPTRTIKRGKQILFITQLIDGIYELQSLDTSLGFIEGLKAGKTGFESAFRDWMRTWLKSHFKDAQTEVPKGNGRMDLKITHPKIGTAIVEFKGWWNQDRSLIVQQLYKYLTDFEKTGYLFIINHKAEEMEATYRSYLTKEGTGYITASWEKIAYGQTDFSYFSSKHKIGTKTKTLYHFIYHLYP